MLLFRQNVLLPASDRIPPHTRKRPTGPFDRSRLLQHLKTQAAESKVGEDYIPFVKKTPKPSKEQTNSQTQSKPARAATNSSSEFDEMLEMLEPGDVDELAAELGLHGLVVQSKSRGDDNHPIGGGGGRERKGSGADVSYTPLHLSSQVSDDAQEADVDDAIESLQSDDPTLTKLNLNNHTRLDPALISQLVEALHGNTHLKTLSLANIRFSEDHAKQLADVLRVNTSLTVLNLESNRITRKGIAAIMKALAENKETVLSELRLANQYFSGGAGAESDIAKHLEKVTSIIRLGYNFTSPSIRTRIDRYIMRNTDLIRQKRASLVV
jgi:hypothetical protein